MTRDQVTVLWLGLIIVALNLIVNLGTVKQVIFGTNTGGLLSAPQGNPVQNPSQQPATQTTTPSNVQVT